jgi:hypothetical protein
MQKESTCACHVNMHACQPVPLALTLNISVLEVLQIIKTLLLGTMFLLPCRWTYVKALWRAVNSICGSKIQFKTTLKGASMLMNSALRDLWMPGLCFFLMVASIITGFVKLAQGPTLASPLIISILWAFVAASAHVLASSNTTSLYIWAEHSSQNCGNNGMLISRLLLCRQDCPGVSCEDVEFKC